MKDDRPPRDPGRKKARDTGRQRKIMTNSSDKASRRNAPVIKAMANRRIRRTDRQALAEPEAIEESADRIRQDHKRKARHWGSVNAATHRTERAEAQRIYRENGGRVAVHRAKRAAFFQSGKWQDALEEAERTLARLQDRDHRKADAKDE